MSVSLLASTMPTKMSAAPQPSNSSRLVLRQRYGQSPIKEFLNDNKFSIGGFESRLQSREVLIDDLPAEVRADLIRMNWIDSQGRLIVAWSSPQKPKPIPAPQPAPKPSPLPPSPAPPRPPTTPPSSNGTRLVRRVKYGLAPFREFLDDNRFSIGGFENRLQNGEISVIDLPAEVRNELIRIRWLDQQGQLIVAWSSPQQSAPSASQGLPNSAEIQRLWSAIEQISRPTDESLSVPPLPPIATNTSKRLYMMVAGYALTLGGCSFGFFQLDLNLVALALLGLIILAIIGGLKQESTSVSPLIAQVKNLDRRIAEHVASFRREDMPAQRFDRELQRLQEIRDKLQKSQQLLAQREQAAREQHIRQNIDRILQTHQLVPGLVSGVGPQRVKTLSDYGIRTAFDVDRQRLLRVSGFGDKLIRDLLLWRKNLEQSARQQAPAWTGQSQVQAAGLIEMRQLQNELADGPRTIQSAVDQASQAYNEAEIILKQLVDEREALLLQATGVPKK